MDLKDYYFKNVKQDDYAAFGKVVSGMDVVDKICNTAKPIDDNGFINIENRPVIESMTIVNSL